MEKILIVYASKQGQTQKIAEVIAKHLQNDGRRTDVRNIDDIPHIFEIKEYDGIIVGAGVHAAGYASNLSKWIKSNHHILSLKPTAFYSVCLGILQHSQKVKDEEEKVKQNLFDETGWYPDSSTIFAGALQYSKYNWLLKKVMHGIAQKAGVETDMSKDYEYTDWNEVREFANHFNCLIGPKVILPSDGLYVCKKTS